MSTWNYGDVWEAVADVLPDAPALTHGERTRHLGRVRPAGRQPGPVAPRRRRRPTRTRSPSTSTTAPSTSRRRSPASRSDWCPINTNYRYADDELVYLWENADAVAVIFHGAFVDRIEGIRHQTAGQVDWLWVDDGTAPCPSWAMPYEEVATAGVDGGARGSGHSGRVQCPWGRGPDDIYMLYTGGTTGMPKGVMWRQDDLFARLNSAGFRRYPEDGGVDDVRAELERNGPGMTLMPACPLMHGTGGFTSIECLSEGGHVVTLTSRRFDPIELLDTVNGEGQRAGHRGRRLCQADPGRPGRPPRSMGSDQPDGDGLVRGDVERGGQSRACSATTGTMLLVDAFSSSEAIGIGSSVSSGSSAAHTAQFTLGPEVRVLDADGKDVEPGSGRSGVLALAGRIPLGYYKDDTKTAATFRTIDGIRVLGARRLRRSGRGRHHPSTGARVGVHQYRR